MFPVAVDLMGGSEQGSERMKEGKLVDGEPRDVWETAEDPPKASNSRPSVNGGCGKRRE